MPDKFDLSVFTRIAETNSWGSQESVSGTGSTLIETVYLRQKLPPLLHDLNIRSLVDAPCGDMNWMRHLDYAFESYTGIDIVQSVIEKLQFDVFPASHRFQAGDIVTDILPHADALLCRDCLVHLPFAAIAQAQELWKIAGFKYILATSFPETDSNTDCSAGDWRKLNMQAAPFYWPQPLYIFREYAGPLTPGLDKSLGIWEM